MNVLRKISIDTVLLWLAVALCVAGLVWLGGAHAWIAALGAGVFVAQGAPPTCPTCTGEGTIESEEPFMMMSAVPCPACSPLTVGICHSTSLDKGAKADQWKALAKRAAFWTSGEIDHPHTQDEWEAYVNMRNRRAITFHAEVAPELAGLALFAKLMAFVAVQEASQVTNPLRSCTTCSRPLRAWQLRFDGGAELRCGRDDCAAKDKLVATREVQVDGTVREEERAPAAVEPVFHAPCSIPGCDHEEPPLESPSQDPPRSDDGNAKSARDPARAPLDIATLRSLAQSAAHRVAKAGPPTAWEKGVYGALTAAREDVPILASAVEQLADALEAKAKAQPRARLDAALGTHEEWIAGRFWGAINVEGDDPTPVFLFPVEAEAWAEIRRRNALPEEDDDHLSDHYQALSFDVEAIFWNSFEPNPRPAPTESRLWEMQCEIERLKAQRGLTSEEMAIIERTRALVRERDDLRASVDLLDEQGRKMKAERDDAKEAERWIRKQLDGVSTSLTKERDAALAQIERMRPVVDLVGEWCQVADGTPEEDAIETRIIDAFGEYQEAGAL